MAITISGINNNDQIVATDGTIDALSGFNVVGVMTAATFSGNLVGNVTGNLTGNVNATSNLLLQIGGSEKFRVASSGQLGIGGANYGTSGQVLTSGGSGSAASWTTPSAGGVTSDAQFNTVGGTNAGNSFSGTSANSNTLFGYDAGTAITTADRNTFIGFEAGKSVTAGVTENVFIGYKAGIAAQTSQQNVSVGSYTLQNMNHSSHKGSTAIGHYSLYTQTSGKDNCGLGRLSGYSVTQGEENVFLGSLAGRYITTGSNNIIIGYEAAGSSTTVSNEITLGNSSITKLRIPGIGVSFSEGGAVISGIVTATNFVKTDGSSLGGLSSDAQSNTVGGSGAGDSFSGTNAENNTLIGKNAGTSINSGDKNTVVGSLAGDALNTGSENTFVGYQAGSGDTSQTANTAVGVFALQSAGGSNNTAIGYRAGTSTGGSANQNVAIGYWALPYVTGGSNFAVGTFAMGGRTTSGSYNISLGANSGYYLGGGQKNIFIGNSSGYEINGGSNNVCLGHQAGRHIDEGVSGNTLLGYRAGYNVDGNNNTIIGSKEYPSNTVMHGQVAIGAGTTEYVRINSTGVGIGTDNPTAELEVVDSQYHQSYMRGSSTVGGIRFGNSAYTNGYIYYDNGPNMNFNVGGSERLRITGTGNIAVGTIVNAGNTLRYFDVGNYNTGSSAGVVHRLLTTKSDGTSAAGLDIVKYKNGGAFLINYETIGSNGYITFSTGENAGAPAPRVTINGTGNLKIDTADKGIDFSANTALSGASNVAQILNHYEMGTYVPTWTNIASSPTTYRNGIDSGTTSNGLSYVRVGKQVTVTGAAFWVGSSINNTRPDMSLPFPARIYSVSGTVSHYSLGETTEIHYLNYSSTTSINFYVMAANSGHEAFGDNSTGEMYFNITYITSD